MRWPRTRYMLMSVCTCTCLTRRWCSPSSLPDAGVAVHLPADGLVGHAHRLEQVVVEAVGAGDQGAHPAEEQARLGPLDDAMVVGGGERHHLAQAQLGQHPRVGRFEPGRIAERAHADDGALTGHQARHGLHRAERPGIGQGHGRPGKVVGSDLVGVDLADQVLVRQDEGAEVEGVGVLDARHEQRAAPVALLLVDGQTESHVLVVDDAGLARPVRIGDEGGVQCGHVEQGADDGIADDVGEADLRARGPGELVVQDQAVDLEKPRRHGAHARRRGDRQAGFHVGRDAGSRTAQRGGFLPPRLHDGRRSRGGGRRQGCPGPGLLGRGRRGHLGLWRGDGGGPVVGEELPPALADRVGIGQETVVHVVDQPGIGAERAPCIAELGHGANPTGGGRVSWAGQVASALPMSYPAALHVTAGGGRRGRAPGRTGTVVFVHGSLDRGESFRLAMRRLPEFDSVAYDRRGYQGSRGGGVVDLGGHIEDLLADECRQGALRGGGPVVAIGHSLGGNVVVGAALATPGAFDSIGAFEPPMPWLGFRRDGAGDGRAGGAGAAGRPWRTIRPKRRSGSSCGWWVLGAWARLTEEGRAQRRADGPALVADLRSMRVEGPPFDVTALGVPSVFGRGGPARRRTTATPSSGSVRTSPVRSSTRSQGAQHGAHLSHPDHFASMARLVVGEGGKAVAADQAEEKGGSGLSLTASGVAWCGCLSRRDSSSSYSAPLPSLLMPVISGELDRKTAPMNITSRESASSGP